jgi:hypothetical protein
LAKRRFLGGAARQTFLGVFAGFDRFSACLFLKTGSNHRFPVVEQVF